MIEVFANGCFDTEAVSEPRPCRALSVTQARAALCTRDAPAADTEAQRGARTAGHVTYRPAVVAHVTLGPCCVLRPLRDALVKRPHVFRAESSVSRGHFFEF